VERGGSPADVIVNPPGSDVVERMLSDGRRIRPQTTTPSFTPRTVSTCRSTTPSRNARGSTSGGEPSSVSPCSTPSRPWTTTHSPAASKPNPAGSATIPGRNGNPTGSTSHAHAGSPPAGRGPAAPAGLAPPPPPL